ncbi:hypothetical protein [Silvibacterium dinghuense]|uniref:Uncharacterized protein n=1 Tax=Silvibacterium dinghuense TaxID=1560006 RepID=A0A4Q1S8T2_9BACT|nr:hypothetical protein [Silvibacterium dinghuense]RXS93020.1 hypothetical protein ESZ00_19490 [Silvibacterium dinghuense]GGG90115.1 hypothetical protein GCM10011586_00660 [Silvibacterium dinghuense]
MRVAVNGMEVLSPADAGDVGLSRDTRWQLAQRIAASDIFAKSELLQKFLLHICELHLRDRDSEIREQNIGVRVFGRPAGYNPGDDNIVRNYAVQLRKRLSLYFEGEGDHEELRVEIPRGGYIPVFRRRSEPLAPVPHPVAVPEDISQIQPAPFSALAAIPPRRDWRMFMLGLVVGLLLCGASAYKWKAQAVAATSHFVPSPLWAAMFPRNHDTLIVPADSGLGILQNLTRQPVDLSSYTDGQYLSGLNLKGLDQGSIDDLRTQRYTSMIDLDITSRLSHLPEVVPEHLVIRYARDLRMDDLRENNAILLGAIHTDPWINLLQTNLNFQFACARRVDDCYILNSHPARGEPASYRSDLRSPYRETYSVLALLPNLDHSGWILLIEGLDMAGTEAAADLLLDDATMRPVIQKSFTRTGDPRGFELLIKTGSLGAQALPAQIVAERLPS